VIGRIFTGKTDLAKTRSSCLFVSSLFPPPLIGGSLVYYHYLFSQCTARDLVVATQKHEQAPAFDADLSYRVHRSFLFLDPDGPRLPRLVSYILMMPAVVTWIIRYRVAVVHVGFWNDLIPSWLACIATNRKLMVTIHGEELTRLRSAGRGRLYKALWKIHERIFTRALRQADRVQANSNFTKSVLLGRGVSLDRIVVTTPGVDLDKVKILDDCSTDFNFRFGDKRILLTVGRLQHRKGQNMVLAALPELLIRHPDLHYVMAGGSTPQMREYFESLVRELHLEGHVTILTDLSNKAIASLYRECEIFVMANREMPDGDTEGYGIVFLEAGAWGKPVIGGRAGGAVEAVDDGVTGLLVDGQDPSDIAAAVGRLLNDPDMARRMGEAGRAKVSRNTWDVKSEHYCCLLRQMDEGAR